MIYKKKKNVWSTISQKKQTQFLWWVASARINQIQNNVVKQAENETNKATVGVNSRDA